MQGVGKSRDGKPITIVSCYCDYYEAMLRFVGYSSCNEDLGQEKLLLVRF